MSKALWKLIQAHVGASADGVPGVETSRKIAAKFGIKEPAKPKQTKMVTGSGRNIKRIVIHCAATPEGKEFDVDDIKRWHMGPKPQGHGWSRIGYHFIITLDGTIQRGTAETRKGIHVRGRNTGAIGVCYIGGVDASGRAKDTRTPEQIESMIELLRDLTDAYPKAKVLGHRDHVGVRKACPSFDAIKWWESVK